MVVRIDVSRDQPLTDQIVRGIQRLVDDRQLRPEARLPSIRQFAATHNVSKFTVVQAYDRLVASGHIESRQGSGFFVNRPAQSREPREGGTQLDKATDVLWLLRRLNREVHYKFRPGCGTLPSAWLEDSGLERAMRAMSRRRSRSLLDGYGNSMGHTPLRVDVSRQLAEMGIDAPPDQILLTNGVIGAIDLLGRYLIRPNDLVLVDDPGYFHTFGHLRAMGAAVQGIPWTSAGPDVEKLEDVAKTWHPRLLVTSPIVHNPTGQSITQGTAFRLLRLAERYDFYIVEDGVDGAYHPKPPPRLAGLDQLNRVIYLNGFSKTLSPRLRVGFIAAHRDLVADLADLKTLTEGTSSELTERLVHEVLAHGQFRKHCAKLLGNLHRTRDRAIRRLEALGLGPAEDDTHGLFAWMDIPGVTDSTALAEAAIRRSIVLAPGAMFSPHMTLSTKMRFNVAHCVDDGMFRELERLLSAVANT